jgi:hypothetical protein
MRQRSMLVVCVGMVAASALSGPAATAQEEETGRYRTALSVAGGLSVGSAPETQFLAIERLAGGFRRDDDAGVSLGGTIAHDITPRLTAEASGIYQERGASAWSADLGLRLNLKPSSESLVPYFAVSGGLYGETSKRVYTGRLGPPFPTVTSHSTDGMATLGGGLGVAAGPHVFVRPDARAQVVFADDTRVLGLFTLNFGYRF